MLTKHRKRLFGFSLVVIMSLVAVSIAGYALADEPKSLTRAEDPVIIEAALLSGFANTPLDQLYLYSYNGAVLTGPHPLQVDERDGGSDYLTTGDGLLNSNDELTFMAADLGDQVTDPTALTAKPIGATYYELAVTDPLSPTQKGWAYLVKSNQITDTVALDYVDYVDQPGVITRTIMAQDYAMSYSDVFFGFEGLELLNSGVDLLDRTKLRLTVTIPPFPPVTATEESLENPPAPTVLKDGPVRLILQQSVSDQLGVATVDLTGFAYASLVKVDSALQLAILPQSASSRTSLDLRQAAVISTTTYYNANLPGGTVIDGSPDSVPDAFSRWNQISHPTGRFIQITDLSETGGTLTNFYRDNTTPETDDTGESGSYGDAGITVTGLATTTLQTTVNQYILPPLNGGSGNVGATYAEYVDNPLQISAELKFSEPVEPAIYLPLVTK